MRSSSLRAQEDLERLYGAAGGPPLWLREGRPTPQARTLVADVSAAAKRGLRPEDYDATRLANALAGIGDADAASPAAQGLFDTALSVSALRYASALHDGRVDPDTMGFELEGVRARLDRVAAVRALSEADDPAAELDALEPPIPLYGRLEAS